MTSSKRKATGAHFTPPKLAELVASRLLALMNGMDGPIRVLDPASGNGNLLSAIAQALPAALRRRTTLIGIEQDEEAFATLRSRASEFASCKVDLIRGDFLDFFDDGGLFGSSQEIAPVDVIIANPPYVRTQVLGARRAQELARTFGLSGRVDLYQAFLVAMAKQLRQGGILGVITSNRFLTTKGGLATRRFLRTSFDLTEVVDLGDTKLFEAAVLPALVFGRKRMQAEEVSAGRDPAFVRIYESDESPSSAPVPVDSVFDCLRKPESGTFCVNGSQYCVTTGHLRIQDDDTRLWTMLTEEESNWIEKIDAACESRIGEVAKVRVGIKTTADKVFIRRDWQTLPPAIRPLDVHLRPLLSQEDAAKWRALETRVAPKRVLYTHEVFDGRRRAIPFDEASPTWQYLVSNKDRLESRQYVIDAGRKWYEIWVPQDPSAWALPKIVFPDISPDARFFLDEDGCIVDGNCYWITTNDPDDLELLLLILGVANSKVIARYHELAFQNRLYAQRRRYLTQYVAEYPLPARDSPASRKIPGLVQQLASASLIPERQQQLVNDIDQLVADAFGIFRSDAQR